MAKVSQYTEQFEQVEGTYLFAAVPTGEFEANGDPKYKTKKMLTTNVGAQGPIGPQGADGPQGIQGIQGIQGDPGPAGANGSAGANGANSEMTRSSTDSVAVGTGAKTFNYTVAATNLGWAIGTRLRAASAGTPANYVEGLITAVNNTQVTINSDNFGGAGSSADWNITIAGDVGATGATGATGAAGAAGTDAFQVDDGWCLEFFDGDFGYAAGSISAPDGGVGWGATGQITGGTIVSRTVANSKTENRLELNNGEYIRQFHFGSEWHRIQIAILWRFTGSGNFNASGAIGICNTTNFRGFNSTNCDNYLGIWYDGSASPTLWTDTAETALNSYLQSVSTRWATRRVNTTTDRGSGAGSDGRRHSRTEAYRSILLLEIARPVAATTATAVTYSVAMRTTNIDRINFSLSKHVVLDMFNEASNTVGSQTDWSTITGTTTAPAGTVTNSWSFDESTGVFDGININWDDTTHLMEIAAIGVRKVY